MAKHTLGTQFGGPAVVTQRNAFGPVAVEAEHDSVALLHMSGHLVVDYGKVVWGNLQRDFRTYLVQKYIAQT